MGAFDSIDIENHNTLKNLPVGDPHPQYQLGSDKGTVSGYASLDGSGTVPLSQLPPSATVSTVSGLTDTNILTTISGQVLEWNGSEWANSTPAAGVTDHTLLTNIGVVTHSELDTIVTAFDSAVIETIDINVVASGTNIELTLQAMGGGDLNFKTPTTFQTLDSTPAVRVNLTSGTATNPVLNYVYVESGLTLSSSTSGWPNEWHSPIAQVYVLDKATTDTDGALKVHAYTDHFSSATDGHITHIGKKLRLQPADWESGVTVSGTPPVGVGGANVYAHTTAGVVFQMHPHNFPAMNTNIDGNLIPNHPTTPWTRVTDLATLLTDSESGSLTGKYYSLVLWGIASEKDNDSQECVNLPSGSYNSLSGAQEDLSKFANYTIPRQFRGTGFLIASAIMRNQGDTTFTVQEIQDLRGLVPSSSAGGGAGVTSHLDLNDIGSNTHVQIDAHISSDHVTSFNTRTGGVVPADGDYSLSGLSDTNTATLISGQNLQWDGSNWANATPAAGVTDHTLLSNIGVNTHPQIDTALSNFSTHSGDVTTHFTEGSIDHTAITNIGSNSHATIDTHISDTAIHSTSGLNGSGTITELAYFNTAQGLQSTGGVTWDSGTSVLKTDNTAYFTPAGTGTDSIRIGDANTKSLSSNGIAIGASASISGATNSVVIGAGSSANGSGSSAVIGYNLTTNSNLTTIIGSNSTINNGAYSIGIGENFYINSADGVCIGDNSQIGSNSDDSIALGTEASIGNNCDRAIAIGQLAYIDTNAQLSIVVGAESACYGKENIGLGKSIYCNGTENVAIGSWVHTGVGSTNTILIGTYSESQGGTVSGIAIGYKSMLGTGIGTAGKSCIAIGTNTLVNNDHDGSVVIGADSSTTKAGQFMIGDSTAVLDVFSHGYYAQRELSSPPASGITNFGQWYVKSSDSLPYFTTASGTEYSLTDTGTTTLSGLTDTLVDSTVSGQHLEWNGSNWTNATVTPAATPGGSATQLQYNNAGSFGGMSGVTWVGTTLATASGVVFHPKGLGSDSVKIGPNSLAQGADTVAIGNLAVTDALLGGIAIGTGASSVGTKSIAVGHNAVIQVGAGSNNVLVGMNTKQYGTGGSNNTLLGAGSISDYSDSTVSIGGANVGNSSECDGAIGIGDSLTIEGGTANVAIGRFLQCGTTYGGQAMVGIGGSLGNSLNVDGDYAIAIGGEAHCQSASSIAIGGGVGSGTFANKGAARIAINSEGSVALGSKATIWNNTTSGIAIGYGATLGTNATGASDRSIAIGANSQVANSTVGAVAIGQAATVNAIVGIALGDDAQVNAGASFGIAIGEAANVNTNAYATAIGYTAYCTGEASIAIGQASRSTANDGIAIGQSADAKGTNAISIGIHSDVSDAGGMAIGNTAISQLADAVAIGTNSSASGLQSVAVGADSSTTASYGVALGDGASSSHTGSVAIGRNAATVMDLHTAIGVQDVANNGSQFVSTAQGMALAVIANESIITGDIVATWALATDPALSDLRVIQASTTTDETDGLMVAMNTVSSGEACLCLMNGIASVNIDSTKGHNHGDYVFPTASAGEGNSGTTPTTEILGTVWGNWNSGNNFIFVKVGGMTAV